MVYIDTSKSATFEDVRNAYHSLDKSLNEICEHILSIEDELREAREALARERRYREFLERMLGYGVSSIVFSIVSGQDHEIYETVSQLRQYHFGRFIETAFCAGREASFLRESVSLLDENHPDSGFDLCVSCYQGYGIDIDYPRSGDIVRQLCDVGYREAFARLGQCFLSGKGIERDTSRAIR